MRCVDVDILVSAHRPQAPDGNRAWLDDARASEEPLGVSSLVLSGFVRIVTHPRIFRDPSPLASALDFAEALQTAPRALTVAPGPRHSVIFMGLCRSADAWGNLVSDAYL